MVLTRINNNIAALTARRTLDGTSTRLANSLERLSSGFRINRASDDAAGLSISELLRSQLGGTRQALNNANSAINVVNVAEGALNETTALLQRIRQLTVQAGSEGTMSLADRQTLQNEITSAVAEVTRISRDTQFATRNLLDGTFGTTARVADADGARVSGGPTVSSLATGRHYLAVELVDAGTTPPTYRGRLDGGEAVLFQGGDQAVQFGGGTDGGYAEGGRVLLDFDEQLDLLGGGTRLFAIDAVDNALEFQIGANAGQDIRVALGSLSADELGFVGQTQANGRPSTLAGIDVTTPEGVEAALRIADQALVQLNEQRSALGAVVNRLDATIANLEVTTENLASAESRIRDTDIAQETASFTRQQILMQAGVSVLAQANLVPQSVLSLLQ